MTATKVSALPAATTVAANDLLYVVSDPGGSPVSKKITQANFFANVVSNTKFANTVTFPLNVKMGANLEGVANGFDIYAPSTLDFISLTYGANAANNTASYISVAKDGGNANTSPHLFQVSLYTGNTSAPATWNFNGTNGRLTLADNGSIYFPDNTSQYTAFNVNTAYTFTNTITLSTNTLNLGSSTNAANGFTYLPNGFKMNWGWVSANSSTGTVTFSSAYSTNVYVVTATSNSAVETYQAAVVSQNSTSASIRTANVASTNVFWQAIGK
jgi:hypothetical protein